MSKSGLTGDVISAGVRGSDEFAQSAIRGATDATAGTRAATEAAQRSAQRGAQRGAQEAAQNLADESATRLARRGADDAAGDAAGGAIRGADDAASGPGLIARTLSDNAGKLITGGLVIGGVLYLEKKFDDADEDTKNCIGVCLPENWDEYKYGDLKKSDLKYREIDEDEDGYDVNQPLCKKAIADCGEYCGKKCEEIHAYKMPGSRAVEGAADAAGDAAGGLFSALFEGLGLDGVFGDAGTASKVSSVMSVLMIVLTVMQFVK